MLDSKPCGIIYYRDYKAVHLPLEQVEVHANIVDLSAEVTITQRFLQDAYGTAHQSFAKYMFPVPARAAVCGFRMTAGDGTMITAVAKDKDEAKQEHDTAKLESNMTGLVEHITDDVFTIALGALPPMQAITCQLFYVIDLLNDDSSDQVRLQIPVSVGMRYGTMPDGMVSACQVPPHRVSISADVCMTGPIKSITGPTHPIVVAHADCWLPSTQQIAKFESSEFLSRDFVLSVVTEGLDSSRCTVQQTEDGVVAMQLSIVPTFDLPPVRSQEYIFLIDCSASMSGDRIDTAKSGLAMLLRSLPAQGTTFNIFRFGSGCRSLWPRSRQYNRGTLGDATKYIDSTWATMCGTEIEEALQRVFHSRSRTVPTTCIVLTDGEVYDVESTLHSVSSAVSSADPKTPLRVFTLGIGETTSTELCEGIARAGNGICLMATTSEDITSKCAKLVRAARTSILKNVTVDWGVLNSALVAFYQGPSQLEAVYPRSRLNVFALIDGRDFSVPREVNISGQRDGQGKILRLAVPVQEAQDLSAGKSRHCPQLIHTLAARRIIMDLEDRSKNSVPPDIKALIVRLGTQYQLASKFTSFIAVDKRTSNALALCLPPKPTAPAPSVVDIDVDAMLRELGWESRGPGSRPTIDESRNELDERAGNEITAEPLPEMSYENSNQAVEKSVEGLVRLQSFDGSFDATHTIAYLNALVVSDLTVFPRLDTEETAWATALAVAYLRKNLTNQPDLLELLVEKATGFIRTSWPDLSMDEVLRHATEALGYT